MAATQHKHRMNTGIHAVIPAFDRTKTVHALDRATLVNVPNTKFDENRFRCSGVVTYGKTVMANIVGVFLHFFVTIS
jgi:hypothetical protein